MKPAPTLRAAPHHYQPLGLSAAGGQQLAVKTDHHPVHTTPTASQEKSADGLPGGRVPQPHTAVRLVRRPGLPVTGAILWLNLWLVLWARMCGGQLSLGPR